ncbi:HIT family protein [uncultured Paraglaciecola sp.]|jgi:diadenosine tetraphosphate (Ap4A) HIT family hydrolase|uniref:HIT domain-containing protein n=1 Tax=uncultured Paraglaciecola sp. TaxID=1765024 RepID=UPI00262562C5|nr:HIT family protein [uncultured Paraglaciecola sp.]|tara:strand:- start:69 stop:491 length:423 start_codon:yes stop_codon:yes gene_type:complete
MANFILHPQLEKDSVLVTELVLCSVRLINDANYPWLILVPRIANISDIIDLNAAQQQMLWQESALVSRVLKYLFTPDKLNIAALGNMVPQLHLHHIARYQNDVSWPKPIWGQVPSKVYSGEQLMQRIELIKTEIEARRGT